MSWIKLAEPKSANFSTSLLSFTYEEESPPMHENMQVNTVNLHRILNFTIIVFFCCTSGMFYCNHRNASSCMAIFNHAPQVQGTAKTPQPHPSGARDCMFPPHLQSPTYRCTYQYVVRFDVGVQHPGSLHQLERQ